MNYYSEKKKSYEMGLMKVKKILTNGDMNGMNYHGMKDKMHNGMNGKAMINTGIPYPQKLPSSIEGVKTAKSMKVFP